MDSVVFHMKNFPWPEIPAPPAGIRKREAFGSIMVFLINFFTKIGFLVNLGGSIRVIFRDKKFSWARNSWNHWISKKNSGSKVTSSWNGIWNGSGTNILTSLWSGSFPGPKKLINPERKFRTTFSPRKFSHKFLTENRWNRMPSEQSWFSYTFSLPKLIFWWSWGSSHPGGFLLIPNSPWLKRD